MKSLFIDTTVGYRIALLNDDLSLIELRENEGKRPSQDFHYDIHTLLEKHSESLSSLESCYAVYGPGSYTGIRLGQGFASTLETVGGKIRTFYRFQIPRFAGYNKGVWICPAYKGETFCYIWSQDQEQKQLVATVDIEKFLDQYSDYPIFNEVSLLSLPGALSTNQLIESEPKKIFSEVKLLNNNQGPYYFRALDKEFSKGKQSIL